MKKIVRLSVSHIKLCTNANYDMQEILKKAINKLMRVTHVIFKIHIVKQKKPKCCHHQKHVPHVTRTHIPTFKHIFYLFTTITTSTTTGHCQSLQMTYGHGLHSSAKKTECEYKNKNNIIILII